MNKPLSRKNLMILLVLGIIAVVLLVPAVLLYKEFFGPEEDWNPQPIRKNGATVFEEHISAHPGFYNLGDKAHIANQIDVPAMVMRLFKKNYETSFDRFTSAAQIGQPAPGFELKTTDGEVINLLDYHGKIFAFMFVAMTCPPARLQTPLWSDLQKEYSEDDVVLLTIYSRERHPGEPGFKEFSQPSNFDQKFENAQLFSQLTDLTVAVDGIDESILNSYGPVSNPAFVISRQGILVFKSQWADVEKVRHVINTLLSENQ